MTDLEKFIDLYKSLGIDLTPNKINEDGNFIMFVEITASMTKSGYGTCSSELRFTLDGKFISQGFFES